MFKHNYLQKLAYDNVRKQKSFYRFIFISLVLVFALSSCIAILFSSYDAIGYKEKSTEFGQWSAILYEPNQSDIDALKSKVKDAQVGYLSYAGNVSYQDYDAGRLDSLDQNAMELAPLTLLKGRLPNQQKELILTENQCTILGIAKDIHQNIELTVTTGETSEVQQFEIVGIIDNQLHKGMLEIGDFITTQYSTTQDIALLYAKDTKQLWNTMIEEGLHEKTVYNDKTYDQYKTINIDKPHYIDDDITNVFRYLIAVLGFIGVFGTMVSSLTKRTEHFALMKAIGATSKQIQKMIVYEGLILSVVAGIVGFIIGCLFSFGVLFCYHLIMKSDFMFVMGSKLYSQIVISIITIVIGIYLPSFEAYYVSLTQSVKQKVKISRVRKVRRQNIFSLAMREFSLHMFISLSMIVIIMIGIVMGSMFFDSIEGYQEVVAESKTNINFDYILYDDGDLTSSDIQSLTSIKDLTSQVHHVHDIEMTWQGIEEIKSILNYRIRPSQMKYAERSSLSYYENEEMIKEVLSQHHMEGRYPQNDHEVLIVKPWINVHDGYYDSSLANPHEDKEYIKDVGLEIGDYVTIAYADEGMAEANHLIDQPLKIVGTITFEEITRKEQSLFTNYYQLITNQSTYQKYIPDDSSTKLLFDANTQKAGIQLKSAILQVINGKHNVRFEDTQQEMQESIMWSLQFILKVGPFCGTFLAGIVVLTYLYRKVKILGAKHEIGLYRAIGATKRQIYLIHLIYGLMIYVIAICIVIFIIVINMKGPIEETFVGNFIAKQSSYVALLGVVFMIAFMLPVHSELKENLMQTITKQ